MIQPLSLQSSFGGPPCLLLRFTSLKAAGQIQPRIIFTFEVTGMVEEVRVQLLLTNLGLSLGDELLSSNQVLSGQWHPYKASTTVAYPMFLTREAINYIDERFREPALYLQLKIDALLAIKPEAEKASTGFVPTGHAWDKWLFSPTSSIEFSIEIHQSEWVSRLIKPWGKGDYQLLTLPIPATPDREKWNKALKLLDSAEEQYHLGNDPGVFQNCRSIFEAIEGAPKHIYDQIEDPNKRERVDVLLRETNNYFHAGRHVSKEGPQQGEFPVDHRDAEFALALAKMFLNYTAKLLI